MSSSISPTTSPNFTARKLVPIKDFNGPILKLTKTDKAKISKLKNEIASYDTELAKLQNITQSCGYDSIKTDYYSGLIDKIEAKISEIALAIKEIKLTRFQIQKAKAKNTTP